MTTKRIILVSLVAAAFPNVASAATLFLKQNGTACTNTAISNANNPQKYVGLAVNVPRADGSFTLTIDNPAGGTTNCTGFPSTSDAAGANQPISVAVDFSAKIERIHFFKNNECQDQGTNFVGLTASGSQGTDSNAVSYTFGFSFTDGCLSNAVEPTFNRTASLAFGNAGTGTTFAGNYHLYNVASVPEPSSLALLGLGLSAVVFMGRRRIKKV